MILSYEFFRSKLLKQLCFSIQTVPKFESSNQGAFKTPSLPFQIGFRDCLLKIRSHLHCRRSRSNDTQHNDTQHNNKNAILSITTSDAYAEYHLS
jgi:hypothetical protein